MRGIAADEDAAILETVGDETAADPVLLGDHLVCELRPDPEDGGEMLAIDCPCGHRLDGADEEELFRLARAHIDEEHPEMERTDEQVRERVEADAYEVTAA